MTSKAQDKHKMSEIDEGISKIFDIKKRLGKGAYGIVWKALDKRTNETIAVKKIFDAFRDETDAQRTFREIVFLKAFRNHPNIVKMHNVYKAANNLDIYLIFEYMESDLHNIIKRGTILKDIHKRYVMYQLINAIKYIHSGNVIHRDLKPSNILIDSKCRCKLADFGLARSLAQHCLSGGDNNDMGNDKPAELLLTDYVATRWYRAPEILVASKKYTKGIDMWSLGCILAEMIRGKPIFQGSSTINQIEKIVYTLPDITEHDIRSVGAGFGSVLLNKQILKDKKTTLNELLSGASGDALDLVKSLLVLDPLGRLTADQALNHSYVEKFRNSIPELELNVDILPPFRDDVRLTVPEYRSKLYEIVQPPHGEKSRTLETNKNTINIIRTREHKSLPNSHDKAELKKVAKVKQNPNPSRDERNNLKHKQKSEKTDIDNQQIKDNQTNANLSNIINRALKKSTPVTKRKPSKNTNNSAKIVEATTTNDERYYSNSVKVERLLQRSKSQLNQNNHHNYNYNANSGSDQLLHDRCNNESNDINRRYSTNEMDFNRLCNTNEAPKRLSTTSKRLHRSAVVLNKTENEMNEGSVIATQQRTPPPTVKNSIRHTKSEVIPLTNTPSSDTVKARERFCYERRLKKLEEEIERYKNEVKSFCREKFKNTTQLQKPQQEESHQREERIPTRSYNYKTAPKMLSSTASTPIKNIYFQLLTKGQHHDYHKSELDLSGNSGNDSSSDHFRNSFNSNSCSVRSKNSTKFQYDKITSTQQLQQQEEDNIMQKQQYTPYRCRPISKFV